MYIALADSNRVQPVYRGNPFTNKYSFLSKLHLSIVPDPDNAIKMPFSRHRVEMPKGSGVSVVRPPLPDNANKMPFSWLQPLNFIFTRPSQAAEGGN